MKIVGLVTEYNPFHNGHSYHIAKAKEITGADAVVVVMSGDYVQRGTPAIISKHLRAKCALLSGASLVLELPVCYATASAEYFALGAISLLDSLRCVDSVCFGSECGDIQKLSEIADLFIHEPEEYKDKLQLYLKEGYPFPQARQLATENYDQILAHPNNILGIEYIKAIKMRNSSMKPYTIQRIGTGYHDTQSSDGFSSASLLRKNWEDDQFVKGHIPSQCYDVLFHDGSTVKTVLTNDLSLLLKAKLLTETGESLSRYFDITQELANRIIKNRNHFLNFEQFCLLLKTKNYTYSRISRSLLHILLDIKTDFIKVCEANDYVFYSRVLGFQKSDQELLSIIKNCSRIPLITKISCSQELEHPLAIKMLEQDCYASDLYESIISDKYQTSFINEKSKQMAIL